MITGQDILCVSSIDWDFLWQGHQEIMTTLAAHGNRVLFIENTGVRSPRPRDLPRLRQRLRNWRRGTKGFRQERDTLFVYSPLVLPFPYSRVACRINRALLIRPLRRWMRATDFQRPLLWTFLPTPLARALIRELDPALSIYYCIDDLASSSRGAHRIRSSEAQLFREADLVFVTSRKLYERASRYRDHVSLYPFGVSLRAFEQARAGPDMVPEDLRGFPRPVVGYVGGLHQWVDQDLLAAVAERLPEASFALVGPRQTDVSRLGRCPNVHFLGMRPHAALPSLIKGFDVGVVPYRLTEYTANVYPAKLNEYLAMGIPVVATDLPELRRFNAEHGEVVAVARDADAFADAIREAAQKASPAERDRRIEAARQNSWEARIAQMSVVIEDALAARRATGGRWEDSLRRLYRTARRRLVGTVGTVVSAYLVLFYTPLVWLVAAPLRVDQPMRAADAIVVFAGGVGESGAAGGGNQERVKQAIALYHEGRAPRIIFSSGFAFAFREAGVMRDVAIAHGVPATAIALETKAASTFENVSFVNKILAREQRRSILLVSSPYHMRRALLTWRKVAPEVQVIAAPAQNSQFYAHRWGASLDQIRGILHEYVAIAVYWWRGWI